MTGRYGGTIDQGAEDAKLHGASNGSLNRELSATIRSTIGGGKGQVSSYSTYFKGTCGISIDFFEPSTPQ